MEINFDSSNLPTGSYKDILMRCINTVNQKDIENICVQDYWKYMIKCTCNNLVGGTEYKITFITRKQNWDDAIFENIARQSTGKIFFLHI